MCKFEPLETAKGYCGKCDDGILKPVIGKREKALCTTHYWESKRTPLPKSTVELKRTPIVKDPNYVIPKVTKKQAKRNTQYLKQRGPYLLENSECVIRAEGCTYVATQVHHPEGRMLLKNGHDRLLDQDEWIGCCANCHNKAEIAVEWAKQNNFSLDRLNK